MKASDSIDWSGVQEAAKRSKLGRSRLGDAELCAAAYKADPVRYREVSGRGHREAIRTVNPLAGDSD